MTSETTSTAREKREQDTCPLEKYNLNFKSLPTSPERALQLVSPHLDKSATRLLDFGCGNGVVSLMLVDNVKYFTGTDLSPEMLAAASKNGLPDLRVVDGHDLQSHLQERGEVGLYDVVFSNLVLHWTSRDPEQVLRGINSALKPGGVFVAQFVGNVSSPEIFAALANAMERRGFARKRWDGFYMPDAEEYKEMLESCGFTVDVMENRFEPMIFANGIDSHFDTFVRKRLDMVSEDVKDEILEEMRNELRLVCYRNGKWQSIVNYLTFRAFKN
ncbi:S-adenosyl-L-methionine-dependent methyltransferase [Ramicandelaber brevisporus]|nr:S-adenosyl-L-methionine-dependent methyltransferase [Ramicandelaber brevisporus]